mgnify:CR=1 FL=1
MTSCPPITTALLSEIVLLESPVIVILLPSTPAVLAATRYTPLSIDGDGNIQLTASGSVQANTPLKPTVNGQLHAVNMNKQEVTQQMVGGVVSETK